MLCFLPFLLVAGPLLFSRRQAGYQTLKIRCHVMAFQAGHLPVVLLLKNTEKAGWNNLGKINT